MVITHYNNTPVDVTAQTCGGFVIRKIVYDDVADVYKLYFAGRTDGITSTHLANTVGTTVPVGGQNLRIQQYGMNGFSDEYAHAYTVGRSRINGGLMGTEGMIPNDNFLLSAIGYTIEFLELIDPEETLPDDPAIWETEPKDNTDLNIYFEASGGIPIFLNNNEHVQNSFIPGSTITYTHLGTDYENTIVGCEYDVSTENVDCDTQNNVIGIDTYLEATPLNVKVTQPNGFIFTADIFRQTSTSPVSLFRASKNLYNSDYYLTWNNCYSFGNGVESNRIRDNFNLPFIANGVKASTTLAEPYKEEHRKYGLIYSGIYNSTSGINNLNQFVMAEKITKDINPIYGSIQKLHSRDTDLVTLCEDKCLKILANKDAVFNADGNQQLTATANVLGQTIPFVGEYGISKNPESFASQAYRSYFTDKQRGTVLRLSMDGLTPISDYGMKDWFRDHLKLGNISIIGSYDDKKDEYNVSIATSETYQT